MTEMSHDGSASDTPSLVPRRPCSGAPAHIKPWEPHPLCRGCLRLARYGIGQRSDVQPAIQRKSGRFVCENKVTT